MDVFEQLENKWYAVKHRNVKELASGYQIFRKLNVRLARDPGFRKDGYAFYAKLRIRHIM